MAKDKHTNEQLDIFCADDVYHIAYNTGFKSKQYNINDKYPIGWIFTGTQERKTDGN